MNSRHSVCFVFALALALQASANAADWAQFRGPSGAAWSRANVPVSWTPEKNVAWKADLPGPGVSSPIVVGDRVFVTCYSGYGIDKAAPGEMENLVRHLVCIDANSGKQLWKKDVAASLPEDPYSGIGVTAHGYASHTPVSDGTHVFCFFGKSGAFAFDMDGNQVWQKNLGSESDPRKWGSSSSPIVYGNTVIVTASAESQAIVALNKETGEEVWRQEASGLDNMWGTPVLAKVDETRTDLVLSVAKEMWGLNPEDGKLRWHCESTGAEQTHSSPIVGGGMIFAFTGRGGGSVAVKAGGAGDVTKSNVAWTGRDSTKYCSPVGHKANVYLVASGIAKAIDGRSGKEISKLRLRGGSGRTAGGFGGLDYPSPVVAGGKLYYLNGVGEMFVFNLEGEFEQVSVNIVTTDTDETFGGSPAISNNKMFLRSNKNLYCVTKTGDTVEPNASMALIAKVEAPEAGARGGFGGGRGAPGGQRGGFGGGGFDPASIFNGRDTNKDGKLTADELTGSSMADRMDQMDKDGDKGISMEEFTSGMRAMFSGGGRGGSGRGGPGRGGFGGGGFGGGSGQYGGNDGRPERPQRPAVETN